MTHSMTTAIKADHICKTYGAEHRALDDVCVDVISGEVLVVMGPSGSGKSTLIRTFNGLEEIDSGELDVLGIKLDNEADPRHVQRIRRRVGMVFQQFNLFPHLSILENITLAPMRVQKQTRVQAEAKARSLLEQMGISEQADKYPAQLSGGQQQRVAIARALANSPKLLLADEPTGNLDEETGRQVMELLLKLNQENRTTLVMITHNQKLAMETNSKFRLENGLLNQE